MRLGSEEQIRRLWDGELAAEQRRELLSFALREPALARRLAAERKLAAHFSALRVAQPVAASAELLARSLLCARDGAALRRLALAWPAPRQKSVFERIRLGFAFTLGTR